MWLFAFQNLLSRPARSLLALLGLTVAISGMVGLFSVAAGMQATVDNTFRRIPGIVAMQPGTAIPLFSKLPVAWADEISQLPGVRYVAREVWVRANLIEGQPTFYPPRFLYGADLPNIARLEVAVYRDDVVSGRFLATTDEGQAVCVISQQLAQEYQKTVGSTLQVDGNRLEVVGIYETNSLLLDMTIVTSGTTARRIGQFDPAFVSAIYIEPSGEVAQTQLMDDVRRLFQGRKVTGYPNDLAQLALTQLTLGFMGVPQPAAIESTQEFTKESTQQPASDANSEAAPVIEVRSAAQWGERIQEFSGEMDVFLLLMNAIGVLIALFSIINTMLMSVTERLTEFGVLRANGWSRWDVMRLILAESAMLGLTGGIFGCMVGYLGAQIMNIQFADRLNLYASPAVLLMSLFFSLLMGMLGGLYPAWWSVRQSPMSAIRRG